MEVAYKRILLKLSGEALAGEQKTGIDVNTLEKICDKIKEIVDLGVEVAIVVGGGNFWRGRYGHKMEKTTSDYMGMLATTINGLALQDALKSKGMEATVQTTIDMIKIAEPYTKRDAMKRLKNREIVIFTCGVGSPFFTTDTGAALKAVEIEAEAILLAKTCDGVYSADPKLDKTAIKYDEITYLEVLNKQLKVMDATATSLCMDNNIPLVVFGIDDPENIVRIIRGEKIGTLVR